MVISALGVPGACGAGGPHNFPPPQNRGQRKSTAPFLLPELVALVPQPFHIPKATEILKVSSGCSWTRSLRAVFFLARRRLARSTLYSFPNQGKRGCGCAPVCVCVSGGGIEAVACLSTPLLCPWRVFYSLTRSAVSLDNKGLAGKKMGRSMGFRESFVVRFS